VSSNPTPSYDGPRRPYRRFWIFPAVLAVLLLVPVIVWTVLEVTGHAAALGVSPFFPFGWFFFPFGFLFFFLVFALLLRAAFWGWGGGWRGYGYGYGYHRGRHWHQRTPQEIAALRYAQGDITSEQYHQILRDLPSGPLPQTPPPASP
jgi:uncharacterized membrane protein